MDTSFETDTVFDVVSGDLSLELVERSVTRPVRKVFPLDDVGNNRQWDRSWLALDGENAVGFIATRYEVWNKRVVIWHLYVNADRRRSGIGRRLLEVAVEAAVADGARFAWLETSNLNVPGFRAYERLGFALCGLDTSLYDGTAAEGEVALFMRRPLP